jgi:hypothetical protein
MINKFDNRYNPLFRWDCENLLDYSGNGLHLTGATAVFRQVYKNAIGLSPPVTINRNSVHDASLQDYDDLTIQLLLVLRAVPSGSYVIAFQASGDTEATNYSWSVQLANANSVAYFSEFGPGSDTAYTATVAGRGLPAIGVPFNLALRRKAVTGGVTVQFFINGVPFGPVSGVLPAPTGGTTDQLVFFQSGSVAADLLGVEIDNACLTDLQLLDAYNRTLGEDFGFLAPEVQSLWVGALTDEGATVAVQLTCASGDVSLAVTGPGGTTTTASQAVDHGGTLKFVLDGLDPDTDYEVEVCEDGDPISGPTGLFHTIPTGPCSFTVAFGGDSNTGSNVPVFDAIRNAAPLMFFQMGDIHYHNIATNDQAQFQAAWNEILANPAQARQAQLYREVPTAYGWDDHDSGPNNHDGSAASVPAAAAVYRLRVPHYPLPDATAIYQTWDIGRVRFVLTDQRSAASANSATDNASKTMLGSAQKTWFKNILSNSSGMLIVWICPRWFGTPTTAGADSWGGFSTERAELASHIHANCPGRVVVLSADVHGWGIDDGSHHDFLSGGGEPLRCFQASPLDIAAPGISGTYSAGSGAVNGVFGTMEVEDTGGSSIDVTWRLLNTAGTQLGTMAFNVAL